MPIDTHPARRGRHPEEIIKEQKAQAEKDKARANARKTVATAVVPTKPDTTAVTVPVSDTRTEVQRYIDEIAPASISGRLIKFSKDGHFVTADDDEPIDENAGFIALCDETLVGWIKFYDDGETPPDRRQGLVYDGFVMPKRETLGDMDPTQWPEGLNPGAPEDPWKHQVCLVLQHTQTRELYTFASTSQTGRRAVGNLLRHYDRMRRANTGEVPVVRLKSGGFNHRDDRIGWVPVPVFAVVGRAPRDSAVKPDTSIEADLNDAVP
jgi:hypothetical protein